jgi:zinc/manganese transport system permease protein
MMDWTFMAAPTAACFIFPPVFTYFGIQVLKRDIVFVDLALAQLAALGATVAFVLYGEESPWAAEVFSLLFILVGGAFFVYARTLHDRIPQEAIIGIVYVFGSATAILLVSRSAHGAEHIKTLLDGSILFMGWGEILKLSATVVAVGALHWRRRERFLQLSQDYKKTEGFSRVSGLWDFVFYFTLGLVIVASIRGAGIYLIFTFLIVPAVCGFLFFASFRGQFLFGSAMGTATALAGLFLSYFLDLPTGSTQVCSFGAIFLLCLVAKKFAERGTRS